jgi:DNA topoisomerase-1
MAKRQASGVAADGSKSKTTGSGGGSGGYKLVIVESPAKARTIQKFLDASFVVESCMGHVRDLPQKARDVPPELKGTYGKMLGVDPDNGFAALYVTMKGKEAVIRSLKAKLKFASELILASDEDREGEAISWHLLQLLKPSSKVHVKRAVFHEITREAILRAFEAPRDVDYNLVHAQEARRILDRLAGYTMSPLLWRKISPGLSAGRVQSVGLAMIVRRERERLAFVSAEYFDLKANLTAGGEGSVSSSSRGGDCFSATLVETEGTAVASGRDFDSQGRLKTNETAAGARGGKLVWLDRQEAERLRERLEAPRTRWAVASVESKQQRRRPPVPFITSTLQQEANRKLSLSSKVGLSSPTAPSLPERRQRPALCSLPRSGACPPPARARLRLSLSAPCLLVC